MRISIEVRNENQINKSIRAQSEAIDRATNEADRQILTDTLSILVGLRDKLVK